METRATTKTTLVGGALAALAASACCLGPLLLVSLGMGGAWLSSLSALEPYRPFLIAVALGFMAFAYRQVFMKPPSAAACEPGTLCAIPATNRVYKVIFWCVSALVLLAIVFPYFLPFFY